MEKDIYQQLRERLDRLSLGYPATRTGVELKLLRQLFSEEDAELFLLLRQKRESLKDIARRLNRDPDVLRAHLEDMAERGLLFRLKRGHETSYAAIAFVAGIYELQIGRIDRELAESYEQYAEEAFNQAVVEHADGFLRTVPVNRAVDTVHHVAPYDDARKLIKNSKTIAVAECICRKQQMMIGQGCDKPLETCISLGNWAQAFLDRNVARKISVEEALQILDRAQEAGLITQPSSSQNPGGICNCCGDCCVTLRPLNRLPKPAEIVFSNYFAQVKTSLCTGCGTCLDRCQMSAIDMADDEVAAINLDRCIGCGLCVSSCPFEAMRLVPKPEDQRKILPLTTYDQLMRLAEKRGI